MSTPFELRRYRESNGCCPFSEWIESLDDRTAARVMAYVDRMKGGNFGRSKPVGSGVSELKIDFGPGFRVYFIRDGDIIVVLLCGGDKSSQRADVRKALEYAAAYWDRI